MQIIQPNVTRAVPEATDPGMQNTFGSYLAGLERQRTDDSKLATELIRQWDAQWGQKVHLLMGLPEDDPSKIAAKQGLLAALETWNRATGGKRKPAEVAQWANGILSAGSPLALTGQEMVDYANQGLSLEQQGWGKQAPVEVPETQVVQAQPQAQAQAQPQTFVSEPQAPELEPEQTSGTLDDFFAPKEENPKTAIVGDLSQARPGTAGDPVFEPEKTTGQFLPAREYGMTEGIRQVASIYGMSPDDPRFEWNLWSVYVDPEAPAQFVTAIDVLLQYRAKELQTRGDSAEQLIYIVNDEKQSPLTRQAAANLLKAQAPQNPPGGRVAPLPPPMAAPVTAPGGRVAPLPAPAPPAAPVAPAAPGGRVAPVAPERFKAPDDSFFDMPVPISERPRNTLLQYASGGAADIGPEAATRIKAENLIYARTGKYPQSFTELLGALQQDGSREATGLLGQVIGFKDAIARSYDPQLDAKKAAFEAESQAAAARVVDQPQAARVIQPYGLQEADKERIDRMPDAVLKSFVLSGLPTRNGGKDLMDLDDQEMLKQNPQLEYARNLMVSRAATENLRKNATAIRQAIAQGDLDPRGLETLRALQRGEVGSIRNLDRRIFEGSAFADMLPLRAEASGRQNVAEPEGPKGAMPADRSEESRKAEQIAQQIYAAWNDPGLDTSTNVNKPKELIRQERIAPIKARITKGLTQLGKDLDKLGKFTALAVKSSMSALGQRAYGNQAELVEEGMKSILQIEPWTPSERQALVNKLARMGPEELAVRGFTNAAEVAYNKYALDKELGVKVAEYKTKAVAASKAALYDEAEELAKANVTASKTMYDSLQKLLSVGEAKTALVSIDELSEGKNFFAEIFGGESKGAELKKKSPATFSDLQRFYFMRDGRVYDIDAKGQVVDMTSPVVFEEFRKNKNNNIWPIGMMTTSTEILDMWTKPIGDAELLDTKLTHTSVDLSKANAASYLQSQGIGGSGK